MNSLYISLSESFSACNFWPWHFTRAWWSRKKSSEKAIKFLLYNIWETIEQKCTQIGCWFKFGSNSVHLGTYQIALDMASRLEGNMRKSQLRDAPKLQGMEEHYHYFHWGDATQTKCDLFHQNLVYHLLSCSNYKTRYVYSAHSLYLTQYIYQKVTHDA